MVPVHPRRGRRPPGPAAQGSAVCLNPVPPALRSAAAGGTPARPPGIRVCRAASMMI